MRSSGEREFTGSFANRDNSPHNQSDPIGDCTLTVVAKWSRLESFPPDNTKFGDWEWYVEVSDACRFGGRTLTLLHNLEIVLAGRADDLLDQLKNTMPFLNGDQDQDE